MGKQALKYCELAHNLCKTPPTSDVSTEQRDCVPECWPDGNVLTQGHSPHKGPSRHSKRLSLIAVSQDAGACRAYACSCSASGHETREVTSSQPGVSEQVFAYLKHLVLTKSGSFRRNNTQVRNDTAKGPGKKKKHVSVTKLYTLQYVNVRGI